MNEFDGFLRRFVASYQGKQLALVASGGGISLSRLALVPGSSRVLYEMSILYSEEATVTYVERAGWDWQARQMVSPEVATDLYSATVERLQDSCNVITMTSALTTNRYRRGDNRAYFHVGEDVWRLTLDKLPESVYNDSVVPWRDQQIAVKRQEEDELVAEVALKLGTGFEKDTLLGLIQNGTLRRVPQAG